MTGYGGAHTWRGRQGLRIEFGNRQLLILEIFSSHGLDLLSRHRLKFFNHALIHLIGNPARFKLADFHGLRKHRIKFVNLTRHQLRLGTRQLIRSDTFFD